MKRAALLAIAMASLLIIVMINSTMAETQKAEPQGCPMAGMMGKKGPLMEDMPMHCMMQKQMVATSDGGIVLTIGNKLYKYDSSLNLQKEVEVPFNKDCMMKMMKEMDMTGDKMDKPEEAMPKGSDSTKSK
jgi:hypothetical protein